MRPTPGAETQMPAALGGGAGGCDERPGGGGKGEEEAGNWGGCREAGPSLVGWGASGARSARVNTRITLLNT